ncbi:MAG: Gfo/Idh/MocA family oxidoreductase [Bacteroidetes bacterium]|nr:Gfo/Idh/MocA family oxidoreductase [Bacteroidota bacterium]
MSESLTEKRTQSQKKRKIKLGMAGYGRIATRFVEESVFVNDVDLTGVFGLASDQENLKKFKESHGLSFYESNYDRFLNIIDAVYIATPHLTHFEYTKKALEKGKHVLCEKPLTLSAVEASELYNLALKKRLVLLEAVKTAYSPGFLELIKIAESGFIGKIKNIDATFTKLVEGPVRELKKSMAGGSMTELSSYILLPAVKLFGLAYKDIMFYSFFDEKEKIDLFTKIVLVYREGIFTGKVGLGVKSEGDLIISGTKGYIYVPAPWWKTEFFEVRFEDFNKNKQFSFAFEGDGLRYELSEFVRLINGKERESTMLTVQESEGISAIIEKFLNGCNLTMI